MNSSTRRIFVSSKLPFHIQDTHQVARELQVDVDQGLSEESIRQRRQHYGHNAIETEQRSHFLIKLLNQFRDVMVIVLIVSAGIAALMQEINDSIVILIIIILNALIGSIQEFRAEKALQALRRISAPEARVCRGGQIYTIPTEDLVPGDIVLLDAGNLVPADLRLLDSVDLEIDESALTGESMATQKQTAKLEDPTLPVGDRHNMAYRGTQITRGHGTGITVAIGGATELGQIANLLRSSKSAMTPLQARLDRFGKRLALAILAVAVIVFLAGLLRGEDILLMLLTAVSLAVAAIPEALPAVVTIALAMGARKLGMQHALMRRLSSVETLGSITYICSDKTGTLTLNRMQVSTLQLHEDRFDHLADFSSHQHLFHYSGLVLALCNNVSQQHDAVPQGDPTEIALYVAARDAGFDKPELQARYPLIAELPFHADRRIMTTLHRDKAHTLVLSKGAPEALLPLCNQQLSAQGDLLPLDRQALLSSTSRMAEEGYRVLALAMRRLSEPTPDTAVDPIEEHFVLLGLVGLMDPARPEVEQAIDECRSAGITPVMITGDHPATALAIAQRLGIANHHGVITGRDLERLSEHEFLDRVTDINVYARVSPEQKLQIVEALQKRGEYVAMTGDGVNDAPSLKRANIGVAMGAKGTDVAREASDMVLTDDNFATIVAAVREGRRIFDNIRKFIKYTMTSNSGEVWTLFLAPFLGLPLPLIPIQILWINLVTDGLPGLALTAEPQEKHIMHRPPRRPEESIFAHGMWQHMIWVGLLIGGLSLGAQAWAYHSGSENWQTVVFTVLTLCQLAHAMAVRSERESLLSLGLLSNLPLLVTILLTIGLQLMVIYLPVFNHIFHTTPLSGTELLVCFTLPLLILFAVEAEKWLLRHGHLYRKPANDSLQQDS